MQRRATTNWHQQGVPPRIDRESVSAAAEPVQPKRPTTNAAAADSSASL